MSTHKKLKPKWKLAAVSLVTAFAVAACGSVAGSYDAAPILDTPDATQPVQVGNDETAPVESTAPDADTTPDAILITFLASDYSLSALTAEQQDAAIRHLLDNKFDLTDEDQAELASQLLNNAVTREKAQSVLRGLDNETRAGRVIIRLENGTYEIRDWQTLQPGDEIPFEDLAHVRWTGVPVFQSPNDDIPPFVYDVQNPSPVITNFIADLEFRHDFESEVEWLNSRLPARAGAFWSRNMGDNLQHYADAGIVPFSRISESMHSDSVWVAVQRNPGSARANNNDGWELTSFGFLGTEELPEIDGIWRGLTTTASNEQRIQALRTFARNNPSIIVVGPDGARITG